MEEEEAPTVTGGGCRHCKDIRSAIYCRSCGRQLKPQPQGRLAYHAIQGSTEVAWKAFGFAAADAAAQRRRSCRRDKRDADTDGTAQGKDGPVGHAAIQGLAAAESAVEKDFAPPTEEQAKIMGLESVVKGVHWNLSTKQLQIMALARSDALNARSKKRSTSIRLRAKQTSTKENMTSRGLPKSGTRPHPTANGSKCRHHCIHEETTIVGDFPASQEKHGHGARRKLSASRTKLSRPWHIRSGIRGGNGSSERRQAPTTLAGVDRHEVENREQETQEQAIALAKGGFRRGRVVFHRKGVKLSEESPRNMPPREAFLKPGSHVLCTKRWAMIGCEGKRRPLFAALSANVEAAETTMKSAHTHTCSGVRLDVRELEQVQRSCIETRSADVNTGLPQILPMTISSTANTSLRSDYTEGGTPAATLDVDFTTPKLATAEKFTLTSSVETAQDSCNASGNSKSSQIEISQSTKVDKQTEIKAKEGVGAVQNDADTGENMVDLRVAPTSTSSHEFSGNWSNAAGTHPKNYRLGRAVLCEDLTHAEVGALVTPECWRDPFQEDEAIQDLQAGWATCLDSLCDRLRGVATTEEVEENNTQHRLSKFEQDCNHFCPAEMETFTIAGSNERKHGDNFARLSLNRMLLRVGARVPWGRQHRGRFAKVLFTVHLGRRCKGLVFVGTTMNRTGKLGIHGCWKCVAADRDLARFLRAGVLGLADPVPRARCYEPERCTAELQLSGELTWACTLLARKAFRLVLMVPGGVNLVLAGVTPQPGREIPWPQDIEEDNKRKEASINIQSAWRGCAGRKRVRWIRMDRESRRRLAYLRAEAREEQERKRAREEAETIRVVDRQSEAQTKLAALARGRAARQRAPQERIQSESERERNSHGGLEGAAMETISAEREATPPLTADGDVYSTPVIAARGNLQLEPTPRRSEIASSQDEDINNAPSLTAEPGTTRLERVLTIDGTQILLTANVKDTASGEPNNGDFPVEMSLLAVDMKARRSSSLLVLKSADFAAIERSVTAEQRRTRADGRVGTDAPPPALTIAERARKKFAIVVNSLTVFNSRRKDVFILSYKGRKVVAQH